MKYARITPDNMVNYYAKPAPTKDKPNRWPIPVGHRQCLCRVTARIRKWLYEVI